MTAFRPADHAMGLELQLEELRERQTRAVVQHRRDEAERLQSEIDELQAELAATAEMVCGEDPAEEPPHMHDEAKLAAH